MNSSSTLFWSHLKMYEDCPQKFLWKKGWDGIDLGNGDGRPKTKTENLSAHHALMGIAIHHAVEKLYNNELWREGEKLSEVMCKIAEKEFNKLFGKMHVDLEQAQMTRDEMLLTVLTGTKGYVQTMKKHKLLGVYAKAEQKIIAWIDKWNSVGGIVDMVIRRDDVGIMLLDGKNAKSRDFVDPDQLVFYALLFKLAYRKTPQKLGLVWFRYPYDEDTGEEGVTWVDFAEEDIVKVAERAKKAKHGMYKKKFQATPSRNACIFCEYKSACTERKEELEVSEISGKGDGFSDFSI